MGTAAAAARPGSKTVKELAQNSAALALVADRAGGVLVGAACGDALGVGYEFVSPRPRSTPHMIGGGLGPYAKGEWSEDTQLAVCLAEITANGADLTAEGALDLLAHRYLQWFATGATDMDAQTRLILESVWAQLPGAPTVSLANLPEATGLARRMRAAAEYFHRRTGRGAGNAMLARAALLGLSRIEDREWGAAIAHEVTMLTHVDVLASDACVLWAEATRRAVTCGQPMGAKCGELLEEGLDLIPAARRDEWANWLAQARIEYFAPPADNSFVVPALQAALGAITRASLEETQTLTDEFMIAVQSAVLIGGDTDTIAATVGGLMGGACGALALPLHWVRAIHGWPRMRAQDLRELGVATAIAGSLGEERMRRFLTSEISIDDLLGK